LVEVGSEALVDDVDELRERDRALPHERAPHLGWAIELLSVALAQRDRTLADLLKTVVLEPDLVVELVRGSALAPGELRTQVPQEDVEPLEVRVLVGDDLAQEAVEIEEGLSLP